MLELIKLKNVFVNFSNRSILSNISISLVSNQIITLIGPNGAGKSTLVRVILKLIQPNTGSVIYYPKLSFGYVPQKLHFNPFLPVTVDRFMRLSNQYSNSDIQETLNRVKAVSLKSFKLEQLSGGEMQRVLLAKALLKNPNVLILDEPTQGIDLSGQFSLYELINQIRDELQCSIFMVSHDLNLVMATTDQVICLNNHICCSGTPNNIFRSKEFISIFGLQRSKKIAIYRHDHNHFHEF